MNFLVGQLLINENGDGRRVAGVPVFFSLYYSRIRKCKCKYSINIGMRHVEWNVSNLILKIRLLTKCLKMSVYLELQFKNSKERLM